MRVRVAATLLLPLLMAACGSPPMEPLTENAVATAQKKWESNGATSYHLVVQVRAPRASAVVYDLQIADGEVVKLARNGQAVRPEEARAYDYSMAALFKLLREDARLTTVKQTPEEAHPADLRVRFDDATGRLDVYRRVVGTTRRRVLYIQVLEYEPRAGAELERSVR
ncbi:MAG: hypothetical protein A3F70_13325 [Acidobacteria bacterium RIFCSPLOWO2_12_FULL_67_14]|nr:MAG: hypothetical protein A3F70_13325 [Acidobacteria bacterium RIFCSPLOWO2_12_FULL_67_14]